MRARGLFVISVVALALVGVATWLALRGSDSAETTVNISGLRRGHVIPVEVSLPDAKHTKARVFVVRPPDRPVTALLGISTHLGCRLWWRGDPTRGHWFETLRPEVEFEDPCGGSHFALDGVCIGGPCPRGLDRYQIKIVDDTAEFDLHHLVIGPPRGSP